MYEFEVKLQVHKNTKVSTLYEPSTLEIQKQLENFLQFPQCQKLLQDFSPSQFLFQSDFYYNHPVWDYKKKDMALRNRKETLYSFDKKVWKKQQAHSLLTFKGKPIDSAFRLRKELEFAVDDRLWEVLQENGFSKTLPVYKYRWVASVKNENKTDFKFDKIDLSFDFVAGLGYYLEIEIMLENNNSQQDKKVAEQKIKRFMQEYNLTKFKNEPISYLGLLFHELAKANE